MTSNTHVWDGWAEGYRLAPVHVSVYHDKTYGFYFYEGDVLSDDLDTKEDFLKRYKHHFWDTLEDYKHGIFTDVEQILKRYEHASGGQGD